MAKDQLNIEWVDIGSVKPYEKNAKKHPQDQVAHIAASLRRFGWKQPLVVDKDGVVVVGHGRLLAAKKLGLKSVPCVCADDLTEAEIKAFRLADNKTNESAWDDELLDLELDELAELDDIDMSDYGFELSDGGADTLEASDDNYTGTVPDEPKAKVGDLYQLGSHRLICGNSTDVAVIDRLMDGVKADMLFTSPPYSDMREYNGGIDLSVSNVSNFISAYRPYVDYQCVNLGIQRKNHEIVQYWDEYIAKARECGYKLLAWNVWDKMECGSIGQQSAFFQFATNGYLCLGQNFMKLT